MVTFVVFVGVAWVVYGRAIDSPFIFDDRISVRENPSIVRLWPLVGDSDHPGPLNPPKEITTSGRPLVNLSLALNYHFGRLDPVGYHAFNLVVHVLSALLLMAIVRRTLRLDYFGGRFERASGPLALAVALLWALHPLQTETVVYITQRTELMVSFFYLATLYGSLRYWAAASSAGRTTWLTIATLACLAGMACKEVMVTAPVIVLLFERTFITGSFRRAWQKSWRLYVGLALGWGLLLGLNYSGPRSTTGGFQLGVPAYVWWFTQAKVFLMYLKLTAWPCPLLIHYGMPYLTTLSAAWPWLLCVAPLIAGTLILLWRHNPIGFVGAWVLVILSPTLVVPIVTEVAAERRMYLPLAALLTLVVVGGYWLTQQMGRRFASKTSRTSVGRWPVAVVATIALLLAVVLSLVSVRRLAAYHDNLTIWEDTLIYQPGDFVVHNNLGIALNEADQLQEASEHLQQALRLKPNYPQAHYNLGLVLYNTGRPQEAIEHYQQALRLKPNYAEAHNNLGLALLDTGRKQEALEHFQQALRLMPDNPKIQNSLGNALLAAGRLPEAIEHYQQALRLNPNFAEAYNSLGVALAIRGKFPEALNQYQEALRLKHDFADAHNNLGHALLKTNRLQEAIEHLEQALRLKSDYAEAHYNLADALIQSGRLPEAIDHFQQALRLNPNYAEAHNNLGNALLAAGRPAEAIEHFQQALNINPTYVEAYNNLAWILATSPVEQFRNPPRAVELAQKAVELDPKRAGAFNTLGVAQYRAGHWQEAIQWLDKSTQASAGGSALDWFFLALAHEQLGHHGEAHQCYDQAVEWMEKHAPQDEELLRFRRETEEVLAGKPAGGANSEQRQ